MPSQINSPRFGAIYALFFEKLKDDPSAPKPKKPEEDKKEHHKPGYVNENGQYEFGFERQVKKQQKGPPDERMPQEFLDRVPVWQAERIIKDLQAKARAKNINTDVFWVKGQCYYLQDDCDFATSLKRGKKRTFSWDKESGPPPFWQELVVDVRDLLFRLVFLKPDVKGQEASEYQARIPRIPGEAYRELHKEPGSTATATEERVLTEQKMRELEAEMAEKAVPMTAVVAYNHSYELKQGSDIPQPATAQV